MGSNDAFAPCFPRTKSPWQITRIGTYRLSGWFEKSGERSLSPLIAIYDNWLINYFQKMGGTPSANINYPPRTCWREVLFFFVCYGEVLGRCLTNAQNVLGV